MAKFRNVVGLALLFMAVSAFGQGTRTIRADVPFSFQAAGKSWPAGDYRVRFDANLNSLTLSSYGSNAATVLTTREDAPGLATKSYLRFERYADTWVLQEASFEGAVQKLRLTKAEREILRADLTRSHDSREIVSDSEALAQSNLLKGKN